MKINSPAYRLVSEMNGRLLDEVQTLRSENAQLKAAQVPEGFALARVISDQQIEIERLSNLNRSYCKDLETVFTRHASLFESFARLLDAQIPNCSPDQSDDVFANYRKLRQEARLQIMETGYCLHCYNFICECDYE